MDQCHDLGQCDPATGVCSAPPKLNGTACSDGNACTRSDACDAGVCTGTNPVVCVAFDQCHDAGQCNTATGKCTHPSKASNTLCDDNNACTQTDTCQAGACTGGNPVVCLPSDQCHDPGICDTITGECSDPAKLESVTCDDSDRCTRGDFCQMGECLGGEPVTCAPLDECHSEGACTPATGCVYPTANEGGSCDDGDACTTADVCKEGTCVGEGEPCVPDAAPPDASIDAGGPGPGRDDSSVPVEVDAADRVDAKSTFDVDAPAADAPSGISEEELVPEEEPVSLYACSVAVGQRPLAVPLVLLALAFLVLGRFLRRRAR
jgi:hypothetical protein